jgi:hypothetical protein
MAKPVTAGAENPAFSLAAAAAVCVVGAGVVVTAGDVVTATIGVGWVVVVPGPMAPKMVGIADGELVGADVTGADAGVGVVVGDSVT